jgi:GGDEF domain-containing protein
MVQPGDLATCYAVLLPGKKESDAAVVAERIRGLIATLGMRHEACEHQRVTISASTASSVCAEIDAQTLVKCADLAGSTAQRTSAAMQ